MPTSHEIALREGRRVDPDMLYIDEVSGASDLKERPALKELRDEIREPWYQIHGGMLIIKEESRLSRTEWHVPYRIEEFAKNRITVMFAKGVSPNMHDALQHFLKGS